MNTVNSVVTVYQSVQQRSIKVDGQYETDLVVHLVIRVDKCIMCTDYT